MTTCRSPSRLAPLVFAVLISAGCASRPDAPHDQRLYDQGMELIQANRHEEAAEHLSELLRTTPHSTRRSEALLALAYARLQLGQPKQTAHLASRVIQENAAGERLDYALYLRANAALAFRPAPSAEQVQRAAEDLETLRQRHPDSQYAAAAGKTLAGLRERLAARELQAARLQLQRNQPVAALNRCRYIIERYPDSNAVAEALETMATAYRRLGLNELAEGTLAIRMTNTPL